MNAIHRQHRLRVATLLMLLLGTVSAFAPTSPSLAVPTSSSRHVFGPIQQTKVSHVKFSQSGVSTCNNGLSSTALAASAIPLPKLAVIGVTIAKFYKTYPIIAGFCTASTKACLADCLAQYRDVCETKFNFKRNLAMVLYSGTILGVSCEIMYNRIFPLIFGPNPVEKSVARAVKMTLFDGFINAPFFWLPPAYIAQALIYGYPKREAIKKYITDVKENGLLKKYWSLWLPMTMINFLFMPAHFRVAFVAGVSFFWMIILSIVANKEQDPDSCPVEPEPQMKNPRAFD